MDYGRISYNEALDMPIDLFLLMKKNATLDRLRSTPEGRQYLEDCRRLAQKEPDYEALRQLPGYQKEEVN